MTNDECQRNDETRMPKNQRLDRFSSFEHSELFRHSSFVLRHFVETFFFNLIASALATGAGTNAHTSPPRRAISLTMRELRYVYSSFGMRKIVSTAASNFRFIRAI